MISPSNSTSISPHPRWSASGRSAAVSCPSDGSSQSWMATTNIIRGGKEDNANPSNLTTLATRLHKKSVRLAQERNSLRVLDDKLAETRPLIEQAQRANREVRRQELQQLMAQNKAELGLFQAQDELAQERCSIDKVEDETRVIKEENENLQKQWNRELETVYAPHELMLQGFLRTLQAAQEDLRGKQERLDRLQIATRRLKDSRKELVRDHQAMLIDIARLKHEEGQGVSCISSAAAQVKHALAQVCKMELWNNQDAISTLSFTSLMASAF